MARTKMYTRKGWRIPDDEILKEAGRIRAGMQQKHGPAPRFSIEQQDEILTERENGASPEELMDQYDLSRSLYNKIITNARKRRKNAQSTLPQGDRHP